MSERDNWNGGNTKKSYDEEMNFRNSKMHYTQGDTKVSCTWFLLSDWFLLANTFSAEQSFFHSCTSFRSLLALSRLSRRL